MRTHGSRANWHPHLHLLVTNGGFRPDGTFVSWPAHDTARLTEAFRRAVLRLFVRRALFDEDQAAGMLTWPHSGFHVHTAVWVPEDDRAFATRLARYCARNPVALERLTYDRAVKAVTYRSDKSEGPTAGTETVDPLEFLARVLVHFPDMGHVTTRYDGWYANRPRGMRRQAAPASAETPPAIVACITQASPRHHPGITHASPKHHPGVTQASVIDRILTHLTHLRPRAATAAAAYPGARSPPRSACTLVPPRRHRRLVSAATVVEASLVLLGRFGEAGDLQLDRLLRSLGAEVVPVGEEQTVLARDAALRFGRGRHPAALNFRDCFSYALSVARGEPLLFVGEDFSQTDVDICPW